MLSMNGYRILITLFVLFWINFKVLGQNCELKNSAFQFGERIDYTIYYHLAGFWVGAGEVYFKADSIRKKGETLFHFNSYGTTFKKYDWIYKVRDHYEAFSKTDNLIPLEFNRKVNEGRDHIREYYRFNHQEKMVYTNRQLDEDEEFVKDKVEIKKCTYDVLSMIYYARNIDFTNALKDQKFAIRIFIDNEMHDTYIRFKGREELKVKDVGTFNCIVFSPLLIEGSIFNAGEDMTVWVTDDKNKIPLLIETPILVGSIRARISRMEGLRHPLKAKVE